VPPPEMDSGSALCSWWRRGRVGLAGEHRSAYNRHEVTVGVLGHFRNSIPTRSAALSASRTIAAVSKLHDGYRGASHVAVLLGRGGSVLVCKARTVNDIFCEPISQSPVSRRQTGEGESSSTGEQGFP